MKTFILNLPSRIKRISDNLDVQAILCSKAYIVFNDEGEKQVIVFHKDNRLTLSIDGDVAENSFWEYIPECSSIKLSIKGMASLYNLQVFDAGHLLLQKDGTTQYLILIDSALPTLPENFQQIQSYIETYIPETNNVSDTPDVPDASEVPEADDYSEWIYEHEAEGVDYFRNYLLHYPDGAHADETRAFLIDVERDDWEAVLEQKDSESCNTYLEDFPDGPHAETVKKYLIEFDDEAWEAAKRKTSDLPGLVANIRQFRDEFPDSRHIDDSVALEKELDEQMWESICSLDDEVLAEEQALDMMYKANDLDKLVVQYKEVFSNGAHYDEACALHEMLVILFRMAARYDYIKIWKIVGVALGLLLFAVTCILLFAEERLIGPLIFSLILPFILLCIATDIMGPRSLSEKAARYAKEHKKSKAFFEMKLK